LRNLAERAYENYQQINSSIMYAEIAEKNEKEEGRKELLQMAIRILQMVSKDISRNDLMTAEEPVENEHSRIRLKQK